jgi:hypothetical protein
MNKGIVTSNVGDTLAIVGAAHIFGLVKETTLTDHYFVLAINAADKKKVLETCHSDLCRNFYLKDPQVLTTSELSLINDISFLFLDPDTLVEKAHSAHERAIYPGFTLKKKADVGDIFNLNKNQICPADKNKASKLKI